MVLAIAAVLLLIAVGWARQVLRRAPEVAAGGGASGGTTPATPVRMDRTWPVMGTILQLSAFASDSSVASGALVAGRAAVGRVDSLMSTYRPESEISALNAAAGTGRWTELSTETATVLRTVLRWARLSGGALDPTVGPLMHAWGFRGEGPARPAPEVLDSARSLVGWSRVETAEEGRRARLPVAGMAVDLGGIAKGYALDLALAAMKREGAGAAMADLGGNVSVDGPAPEGRREWNLGIRNPRGAGTIGTLRMTGGSVATSGDYEQRFVEDGIAYTHIMDPRTGLPVRGMAQVTVAAPDGITADALSTLLFVLGPREGQDFAQRVFPRGGPTVVWVRDPGGRELAADLVDTLVDPEVASVEMDLPGGDPGLPPGPPDPHP